MHALISWSIKREKLSNNARPDSPDLLLAWLKMTEAASCGWSDYGVKKQQQHYGTMLEWLQLQVRVDIWVLVSTHMHVLTSPLSVTLSTTFTGKQSTACSL